MSQPEKLEKDLEKKKTAFEDKVFGALHLINLAVVPGVNITCDITNADEIKNVQKIFDMDGEIVLVTSKIKTTSPMPSDIFEYGCLGKIDRISLMQNGSLKVNIQGRERVKILSVLSVSPITLKIERVLEKNIYSENAFKKMN